MSGLIKVFENNELGKVRIVLKDGEPWFIANDVASALGYAIPKDAVAAHCKYAELFKGGDLPLYTNSPRGIKIIPEADVYRLIIRSNLPSAVKFEKWVMEEVLPQIRKTGSYNNQLALPDFTNPAEAARAWAEQYEKRQLAEKQAAAALEQNETLREIVGCATEWKQVKAIPWLSDYYDTSNPVVWQQVGKALASLSRAMGKEIRKAEDSQWGTVNVYHITVIELFYQQTINNPNMLAALRK